jgi:hypothetical protein
LKLLSSSCRRTSTQVETIGARRLRENAYSTSWTGVKGMKLLLYLINGKGRLIYASGDSWSVPVLQHGKLYGITLMTIYVTLLS